MEEKPKKTNYFVRILIVIFSLGLAFMVGYNFICVEPVGVVKNGIYILLSMLLILVLAESFDNFSIGKLISIKREVKIKKDENKKLERKNSELISHLISITNNQNQKQQSTNVFGDYYTETPTNLQSKETKNSNVQELIDRIGNSKVITNFEKRITSELEEKGLNIEGETVQVLLRHLAGTQLILAFERVHSVIFGSQIYLLKELNRSIPDGMTEDEVFAHYDRVKQHFKETFNSWNEEQYLAFLYNWFLIIKDDNDNIHITDFGVEYLIWIARDGKNEDKLL